LNKHDFISLVEAPQILGKQHISSLRSVTADFPYFQTAQLLLTKALYNEKHYEFEKQLKHVSLMSPDRAVLFRFIHNINTLEPVTVQPLQEELSVIEAEPQPKEFAPDEQPLVTAVTINTPIEPVVEEKTIEPSPIELEISIPPQITEVPDVQATIIAEPEKPETHIAPSQTHSFAEWLLLQQKQKIVLDPAASIEKEPVTPSTAEPKVESTTHSESQETTRIQEEIAQQVIRSNVNEFESILDKFIRENPRISRGKAEFYNPVNMARQSVEDDNEIVTETLANVYYKQGHYKKAIKVYEKLCLIYPHKMPYFASLIQKIKTENKD
jgi:tetratricopeptide (TPR) repeat protein